MAVEEIRASRSGHLRHPGETETQAGREAGRDPGAARNRCFEPGSRVKSGTLELHHMEQSLRASRKKDQGTSERERHTRGSAEENG